MFFYYCLFDSKFVNDQVNIEIKTESVKNYIDTHPLWVKCSHHLNVYHINFDYFQQKKKL